MFISLYDFSARKPKVFLINIVYSNYETLGGADDCMHGGETLTDR